MRLLKNVPERPLAYARGSVRRLLILAVAVMPASLVAGDWDRYREDFRHEYKLTPNGRLTIEGFNGTIDITGWERDTVEITGTKHSSHEDILKGIRIDIVNTPDSISVKAYRPKWDEGWWNRGGGGVKFLVRVPKKVHLDKISTSNGTIRVESIDGSARLDTSNGTIRVAYLNGALDARTSNGKLELRDINGGMILKTSNGSIAAENVKGSFEASTSNGAIRARLGEVPASTQIRANSSNGPIDLTLGNYNNNDVRVSTSNSSITIGLPPSVNANIRASTSNSNVSTDYEVSVRGSISKNRIEGRIGNGGALIDLSSSNGAIRIQKI